MKIQIKNRWTGELIIEGDFSSLAELVVDAVRRKLNLDGANLSEANLSEANLSGANLSEANLSEANLYRANLSGANLYEANLYEANLYGANLDGAILSRANLDRAILDGAILDGAILDGAILTQIRDDVWAVLSAAPREVVGLREALAAGKINGHAYDGDCCCLVGTLEKEARKLSDNCPNLRRNSSRPAEVWFYQIKTGHTPNKSFFAKKAMEWVDEWIAGVKAAFATTSPNQ